MSKQKDFLLFSECNTERMIKSVPQDILKGDPEQGVWLHMLDQSGAVKVGVWECSAGTFKAKMENQTEFCQIIEGEAEITNLNDGITRTVSAGDAFFMENGLATEWYVAKHIKKHFVISAV